MIKYIAKRLGISVVVLLLGSLLMFVLAINAGDPLRIYANRTRPTGTT